MIPAQLISENVGWRDIPVGAFFMIGRLNSCTAKAWGKVFRKVSVDAGIDTEDPSRPQGDIFFEPSDEGYNIVDLNIGTDFPEARELTAHRVNGLNEALRIFVLDQPGHGGASHEYTILVPYTPRPPYKQNDEEAWAQEIHSWGKWRLLGATEDVLLCVDSERYRAVIQRTVQKAGSKKPTVSLEFFDAVSMAFQNGPIKENGVNGISQEALIAILIDRLEGFQSGQFKCHDNQVALDSLQNARLWLHKRTMDRVSRNVEGTTAV